MGQLHRDRGNWRDVDAHLNIALARAHRQSFFEELAEGEGDVALGGVLVGCAGVAGDVEPGNAEPAGGAHDVDESLEDGVGLLSLAVRGDSLVSDGCYSTRRGASEIASRRV